MGRSFRRRPRLRGPGPGPRSAAWLPPTWSRPLCCRTLRLAPLRPSPSLPRLSRARPSPVPLQTVPYDSVPRPCPPRAPAVPLVEDPPSPRYRRRCTRPRRHPRHRRCRDGRGSRRLRRHHLRRRWPTRFRQSLGSWPDRPCAPLPVIRPCRQGHRSPLRRRPGSQTGSPGALAFRHSLDFPCPSGAGAVPVLLSRFPVELDLIFGEKGIRCGGRRLTEAA